MLIRFDGGPRDGQTVHRPDDPPDVLTCDFSGWRHTYRLDAAASTLALRAYRHDATATGPIDTGAETERPADARERLRRTAQEPWPPSGAVGPGDVPGGRIQRSD